MTVAVSRDRKRYARAKHGPASSALLPGPRLSRVLPVPLAESCSGCSGRCSARNFSSSSLRAASVSCRVTQDIQLFCNLRSMRNFGYVPGIELNCTVRRAAYTGAGTLNQKGLNLDAAAKSGY